MVFKINIEGNEIYFAKNLKGLYSKTEVSKVKDKRIYSSTGKYNEYYKVLNKIYTDFHYVYGNTDNLDVTFHLHAIDFKLITFHGDVEVTNSYNEKHLITDVYTRMELYYDTDDDEYKMYSFKMFRGSYSSFELLWGYMFSHCKTFECYIENDVIDVKESYLDFKSVCLGSSELKDTLYKQHSKDVQNIDLIQLFLLSDSFIRWESIEGGPYRYIGAVYGDRFGKLIHTHIKGIEHIMPNLIRDKRLKPFISKNQLKIENSSLHLVCNDLVEEKYRNFSRLNKAYHKTKLDYYQSTKEQSVLTDVYFNNEPVVLKIRPLDISIYQKYIDSIFCRVSIDITDKIEDQINKALSAYSFENKYVIID